MEIYTLTAPDYTIIFIYLLLMVLVGGGIGLFVRNINDYFTGSGSVPWHLGAVSNYMTMVSTFMFVAHAGIAYEYGLVALLILWSPIPPTLFATFYFGKRWKRAGLVSPVEFLETRYNFSVRQLISWGGILFRLIENMVRLYAAGLFIATTTSLSMTHAIMLCGGIVIIYTMIGGIWSVVLTDTIQCVILVLTTSIMIPLTLSAIGGVTPFFEKYPDHLHWNNGPKGHWLFLSVYYIIVTIKYCGNWSFAQRFYSMKDERSIHAMGLLAAFLYFVFPFIFLFPAITAPMLLPNLDNPERVYIEMCLKLLPPGLMGLMISAMFAACMSTLSAEYNITAGVLIKDVYQRLFRSNAGSRELIIVARLMTAFIGMFIIGGALFVEHFGGAFEVNKLVTGLFGVPLVVPVVFGLIWKRPRPAGAVVCVLGGVVTGIVLNLLPMINWETATLIQTLFCIGIFFVSSYIPSTSGTKETAYQERIETFFQQLATPYKAPEETSEQQIRRGGMMLLFSISLGVCGFLFFLASLFSIGQPGSRLAFYIGILCILCSFFLLKIKLFPKNNHVKPKNT
ncbi:MAG: sodium/solute symporter [Planctomycetaceae bacterium]|jgi:SSS family transporter|nr:sodium/solute symporter [Planctomycetaceae bacterium]